MAGRVCSVNNWCSWHVNVVADQEHIDSAVPVCTGKESLWTLATEKLET